MQAVLAPPAKAEPYWRRWRAEISLDTMSQDCVRLLPLLAPSSSWLEGDPAKNLIVGLSKRAWARNQIMLRLLAEAVASLKLHGVPAVVVGGPPAWAVIHQSARSFRSVTYLEVLVPRAKAMQAVAVLSKSGWTPLPNSISPEGDALDYVQGIWLNRSSGERLKLNWRLFPAPPEFTAEWESLQPGEETRLSDTVMFACALAGERAPDDLNWLFDAAILLRGAKIDWRAVGKCIRFAPEARAKLAELARVTGLPVPSKLQQEPEWGPVREQWDFVWREYNVLTWTHRQSPSFRGFLQFLCQRWQSPALLLPFFGLFYLMRYAFGSRTGGAQ